MSLSSTPDHKCLECRDRSLGLLGGPHTVGARAECKHAGGTWQTLAKGRKKEGGKGRRQEGRGGGGERGSRERIGMRGLRVWGTWASLGHMGIGVVSR